MAAFLHCQGRSVIPYLDDWLTRHPDRFALPPVSASKDSRLGRPLESLSDLSRRSSQSLQTLLHRDGRLYGGFPDFKYLDRFRPQAPFHLFGTQNRNFGPTSLGYSAPGPPGYDHYKQQYSGFLYQQTGSDPFPYPVTSSSRSFSMASNSGHCHQGQVCSELSECDKKTTCLGQFN